jgi:DNA-binding SARP family transcriptional activator/tetratricopeptide (TPR) repeat protein
MRALLAFLVVEAEHTHHREMLAGLLWPEVPDTAARHSLSQILHLLRQVLSDQTASPPFFLTTWQTVRFNPESDYTLDVADFQTGVDMAAPLTPEQMSPADAQQLTQAVARYQGEFLSTPLQVDSQAFEEWRLLKQSQLHMMAGETLDLLGQYHLLRREYAAAAAFARQQIELDDLREGAHRQLMLALALDGRRSEALAQYTICQSLLGEELGIEPAAETTALYERIRTERVTDVPSPPKLRGEMGSQPLMPFPPFVGRQHELTRLEDTLTQAMSGDGKVLFITGEAGSGKTALLDAFVRSAMAAHPELLVVNSSGSAYTGLGAPYWPFIEILRQLCGETDGGNALSHPQIRRLAAARTAILPLMTESEGLLAHYTAAGGVPSGVPGQAQTSAFDQITRTLNALTSRHPLLIVLDDLQWADRDSLNVLMHLGRRLSGQRLFIAGAFRPDALRHSYAGAVYLGEQEAGERPPLAALVHELQRTHGDIHIDLAQAEGRAFIDALLDSDPNHLGPAFRETLHNHTGGHALFTTELLRGMRERGDLLRDAQGYWVAGEKINWGQLPTRVEAVIAERIEQLLPDWQAMLAVASVEGAEFSVQVLARVLDIPETEISRRLSGPLARHHYLVAPIGVQQVERQRVDRYRFRHLLFQKYLYERLDAIERGTLHLTVGSILGTLYPKPRHEVSLSLARHFELGGDLERAAAHLLDAGRHAAQLAAVEEALPLLTHGLALLKQLDWSPQRTQVEMELQLALGTALIAKGWSTPERAQAFERARELSRRAGAVPQLARSLMHLADVALGGGDLAAAADIGEGLLDISHETDDPTSRVFACFVLGSVAYFKGNLTEAHAFLQQSVTPFTTPEHEPKTFTETNIGVRSLVWLTDVLWMMGYADQALACSQQAKTMADELQQTFALGLTMSVAELMVRQRRGEWAAMRTVLHQLDALDASASLGIFRIWAHTFHAWLSVMEDEDPHALARLRESITAWDAAGASAGRIYQRTLLAEAYLESEQPQAVLPLLEQMLQAMQTSGFRAIEAEVLRLQGKALRMQGQLREAGEHFQHAVAVAQQQGARAWELRALVSLCQLHAAEDHAAAQQLADLYAWFTEGHDTHDLREARRLLEKNLR